MRTLWLQGFLAELSSVHCLGGSRTVHRFRTTWIYTPCIVCVLVSVLLQTFQLLLFGQCGLQRLSFDGRRRTLGGELSMSLHAGAA